MLKIYLLFFMLLLCFHTKSQSNYLQSFGSTATDEALKNTTDIWGNVYTTGFFSNTCKFDTVTLTSKGAADIFVCKQNASGTLLWSISAGGNGSDRAYGLSSDKWGNLFITGVFADSASFGNFTLLSKNNTQDIFIAKIDSGGNFLWAKLFGGNDIDISLSCMADTNGNVIFTGQFKDSIYFGNNGYLSAFNPITNSVSFDMFIAKCDSAGNIVWSKTGSSKYDDRGLALTIDEKNSIYLGFQFSDTLDFGTVYNNIGFNASALCKMDENGNITWFKKFIASSVSLYNLAYAQNSIYMAGDYSGKMILPQNPISYLQTPFINQLFLIRMRPDGSVANAFATGSNNQLHCYSLASDAQGTACIGGVFECEMTALNQEFGDALFKSVGEYDVFYAAYDTLANRLYARHIGGHGKDNCASVTMQNKYHPTLCGSFEHIINVPDGNNFQPHGSNSNVSSQGPGIKPNHCGEAWYGKFISCLTNGNKDIFFAQPFDSTRAIYDYYFRTDTNCVHPVVSPFINGKDTIIGCDSVPVSVWLPTGQNAVIGPQYNFLWSNGKTEQSIYATNTGFLYVTISTNDNCMSYKDSIYIILYPAPNLPSITNYGGIPFTAIPIDTCIKNILVNFPDTIMLVGINSNQGYSTYWQTPNGIENGDSLQVWQPGAYTYNVTAPGGICSKNDCIEVYYYAYNGDSSQCIGDTIYPQIYFVDSLHEATDTVTLCAGESFKMFVADSIDYYNGNDTTLLDVLMEWKITGGFHWQLDSSFTHTFEFHYQKYIADSTSLCNVEVIIHHLISGLVIATISRDFYLKVNQPPADTVVAYAPAIICPGDTELVYLTGCDSFTVAGSGIAYISQYGDSILIYKGGAYSATYTLTDTLTGCSVTKTKTISIDQIETPDITAIPNNALLCPGDSVLLIADTGIAFVWYGPLSTIIGYTQSIYATSPGLYHYVWTDTGGCTLTSNFMEIIAYTSPFITASPGNQLCEGGTITLNISTNDSSVINWHPPLSGSMLTQVIDSAGTYSCDVTVCGITTTLSIVITNSNLQATIVPSGPIQICQNSGTMLVANLGMILYDWQPGGNSQPYNYVTNAGTYTVMITDSFGCTAMDTVIVDTLPTISPPSALQFTICKGDSLLINATNPVAWFSQADLNSLISIADTFQTSAIFNDTIIYIAANDSPCFSDFVPVSIYVNPASLLSILLDDTIICKGDSIILYATYLPQVNYQWSGPGNITATNDSLIIYNFDSTNVGYYFLQFSDSLCPGGLDSIFLNLINSTAITVTGNMQLCNGDTLLLIANSVSSTTYSWTSPLGTHTTNDTLLIYPATLADSGTYILNATQFNCLMDSISIPVSVFPVPALPIITGDTIYCMGDTIKLQALVADTGTYLWNYLLGIQAGYTSLLLPANNLTMGGLYTFSITANGCKAQDSVLILVKPLPFVNNFQSIEKCVGDSISINQATQANTTYQWLFNGNNFSSNANLFFNSLQSGNGGQYQLIANMNGCTNISDTFSISVYDYPNFDLGEEKYECINIPIDFLGPIGYANYNWNGLLYNSNNYTANDSGWVILVIDNQGCKTADSTYLHWLDCNIFIPNVFTPNNDNFNDTWQVYYGSVKQISIQILNRWGQQIKILNSVEDSWDGTYKDGAFAPEGVYYYLIDAIDFYNKPKSFTGSLTLIRD